MTGSSPHAAVVEMPFHVHLCAQGQGVLRLRKNFASRSSYCAQDDMVRTLCPLHGEIKVCSPPVPPGPSNHKTRAPTSAHTTPPSPSASATEATRTAAP